MASCFDLLNLDYFNNIIAQINNVGTANELQTLVNTVYGDLSLLESTITSQEALLGPIAALLTAPTNPTQVITWIGNFITDFLTPYVKPLTVYASQLTAIAAQVTTMTAAVEAVAAAKFPGATITIPPVTVICTL